MILNWPHLILCDKKNKYSNVYTHAYLFGHSSINFVGAQVAGFLIFVLFFTPELLPLL